MITLSSGFKWLRSGWKSIEELNEELETGATLEGEEKSPGVIFQPMFLFKNRLLQSIHKGIGADIITRDEDHLVSHSLSSSSIGPKSQDKRINKTHGNHDDDDENTCIIIIIVILWWQNHKKKSFCFLLSFHLQLN